MACPVDLEEELLPPRAMPPPRDEESGAKADASDR
jgi:hypothetical protein